MLDTLQTVGATFYPLRDADDAACLTEAAARAPAATPRRAERIVEFLASSLQMVTATSCQVMQFFSKVHGHGLFDAVVSSIPDSDGQIIVTDRTCIVCSCCAVNLRSDCSPRAVVGTTSTLRGAGPRDSGWRAAH